MSKTSSNLTVSEENLKKAIQTCHRDDVIYLLKQNALNLIPENEKEAVCKDLLALRSMTIVELLSKNQNIFTPEFLQLDFSNWQNREFIKKILEKYSKKFDWNTEDGCKQLMTLACTVDSTSTVQALIRQKKSTSCYPMLGSASPEIFSLVSSIKPADLNADLTVELFMEAVSSSNSTERLNKLKQLGYDLETKNSKGETLASLLSQKIAKGKYPKNKTGELLRTKDKQTLQALSRPEREVSKEKKFSPKKTAICVVAGIVVVAAAFGLGYITLNPPADSTYETEYDDSSTVIDYNTDTSLVVEDGDTVNIDYIGYVDDVPFSGGDTEGLGTSLTIGSGTYIDDFEQQLIGHNVGENVTVTVTFPEDYGAEELNGKEARFDVTINGIYDNY